MSRNLISVALAAAIMLALIGCVPHQVKIDIDNLKADMAKFNNKLVWVPGGQPILISDGALLFFSSAPFQGWPGVTTAAGVTKTLYDTTYSFNPIMLQIDGVTTYICKSSLTCDILITWKYSSSNTTDTITVHIDPPPASSTIGKLTLTSTLEFEKYSGYNQAMTAIFHPNAGTISEVDVTVPGSPVAAYKPKSSCTILIP